jgi:hypothetical protein
MGIEERLALQKALREITTENDTKKKVIRLVMEDGYFDETGKLAKSCRQSE